MQESRPSTHPRSQLWAELKRLAPENAAKLSYTQVSAEQLEPMVEEAAEAKKVQQAQQTQAQ
ncbi:MAG TPA: hypothetical protein VM223_22855 [Planctomycetota bacterium]|nr:hypothetical protein [Planctomycetota bacterium]